MGPSLTIYDVANHCCGDTHRFGNPVNSTPIRQVDRQYFANNIAVHFCAVVKLSSLVKKSSSDGVANVVQVVLGFEIIRSEIPLVAVFMVDFHSD
jgi:hypothetical protein